MKIVLAVISRLSVRKVLFFYGTCQAEGSFCLRKYFTDSCQFFLTVQTIIPC